VGNVPLIDGLPTAPYITTAEFLASPTWLDNQDLVPGGDEAQQEAELYNVLLKASGWANRIAEQTLAAHTVIESDRYPVDPQSGNLYIVPLNNPVRLVQALAYGSDFQNLSLMTITSTNPWIERQESLIVSQWASAANLSSLQFGPPTAPGADFAYVQYKYVAGYCTTTLTVAANAGDSQVTVADPTGLVAAQTGGLLGTIPGSVARIWDPGFEEAFQVSNNWVAGTNPVLLASPLQYAHAVGAGVSELPAEVHQAIQCLTVALLMREDVSYEEPFGQTPFGPTVREAHSGGQAGGLIGNAREILLRYAPRVH
jgi:hypothetical protein